MNATRRLRSRTRFSYFMGQSLTLWPTATLRLENIQEVN